VGTTDLRDRLHQVGPVGKEVGDAGLRFRQRQQQVLGRDVLVGELRGLLLGLLQDPDELLRGADVGDRVALQARERLDRLQRPLTGRLRVGAEALEDGDDDALVLLEQGGEEVRRGDLGVGVLGREPLRGGDGLLGLDREAVLLHVAIVSP
jgi:hypothetical protein